MNEMKDSTKEILEGTGFFPDEAVELAEVEKLTKDMKTKILNLESVSREEVRTLVNLFYQCQKVRKGLTEQIRSIEAELSSTGQTGEVNIDILKFVLKAFASTEKNISTCLELVCQSDEVGRWLLAINGIGPVLAAGCLSYFDVTGKEYASQFISYAGLNDNNRPWLGVNKSTEIINEILDGKKTITDDDVALISVKTQWPYQYLVEHAYNQDTHKWSKTKLIAACSMIPYNASLKTHMYKVGSSFQWLCNNPDSKYGQLFSERRIQEIAKNEAGEFAPQAAAALAAKNYGKETNAYKAYIEGKLPKQHINMRAMRYAEKIFISHLFEEMYRVKYDKIPPRYYALEHLGGEHNKEIAPEVPYTKVSGEM